MNWAPKSPTPPPGYSYGSRYHPSWSSIARGILYILRGAPRSLAHDALYALADMPRPPLVRGEDRIPPSGPFVAAANHYERPGMWMIWPALFLAHIIQERTGQDTQYVAIETWESLNLWGVDVPPPLIKLVFQRTFAVYGILSMASPDAPAGARARSVRLATNEVRQGHIVALMPEGTVGSTPELLPAAEGVGTFLALLHAAGAPILPVGLYEENDHLVAHVGETLNLHPPRDVHREERDRWAREAVMRAIRDLLPPPLWGVWKGT